MKMTNAKSVRALIAVLGALLWAPSAGAEHAPLERQFAPLIAERHTHGLFWRIERPGTPASYLLGTVHVDDPRVLDLPPVVQDAVENADLVCTEVLMDFATLAQATRAMFFTDGRTLSQFLTPKEYERLHEVLVERGFDDRMVRHLKPWAALYGLSAPPQEGAEFLDLRIYLNAVRRGQEVCGLETAEEHTRTLDGMAIDRQLYLLRQSLADLPALEHTQGALIDAYLRRDLAELVRLSRNSTLRDRSDVVADFVDRLVVRRNQLMVERMLPRLARGNAVFAVGALHLPGRAGMLQLLERAGYRVHPVW